MGAYFLVEWMSRQCKAIIVMDDIFVEFRQHISDSYQLGDLLDSNRGIELLGHGEKNSGETESRKKRKAKGLNRS